MNIYIYIYKLKYIYIYRKLETHYISCPYLDVTAVSRKVHLHHKAGNVPAAVDAVQLRPERQVIKVHGALSGSHGQVSRIWTEPEKKHTRRSRKRLSRRNEL